MNLFKFITDTDLPRVWGRVCSVLSLFLASSILANAQAATDCTQVTEIPQAECETLVALYNSTDGGVWTDSPGNNWNVTNTPCSWTGVSCSNGHVTEIWRREKNLVGTLPDLSALVNLWRILLDNNQLSGSIPDLSALVNLHYLFLYDNQLSGSIPDLSTLVNLQMLSLSSNQLSGSIHGLNALVNLQWLGLDDNQLSGSIPDLSALVNLRNLLLHNNQLSRSISDLSTLVNLQKLHLNDNQLSGPIPDLSALVNLQELWLYRNQLSGSIPDLSALINLETLYLYNNQLSGPIPNLSALVNLQRLYLGGNQLNGEVPNLSALANLQVLSLSGNQLSGSIPDLSALTNLENLALDNNKLSGSIPDLSALNLRYLSLNNNQLSGSIPDLTALSNLFKLWLNNNQLSGDIPISLSTLSYLYDLKLDNNCLTASDPILIAFIDNLNPGWETTQNNCSSSVSSGGHLLGSPSRNGIATPTAGFGVNAVTGNFFHEEVDAALPGKEIPFVFSRAYNSLAENQDSFGVELPQPLGPGWTHAYHILLRTDANQAEVIWGDGRRDGFSKAGDVWQASSPGNFALLAEVSNQPYAWELTTKAQTRYRFDANQRLTAIVGRNDYQLQLSYSGDELDTITDTAGRTIQLSHTNGLLTQIKLPGKTPLSRTIELIYTGVFLGEVKDMNGNSWRYTYHNGKLRRIYRANANTDLDNKVALQLDYDAQSRVEKQRTAHHLLTANTGSYLFDWATANTLNYRTPTGQGAEFVWDEQQRVVKITPVNTSGATTQDISYHTDSGPESLLPVQMEDQVDNPYGLTYTNTDLTALQPPLGAAYAMQYNDTHDTTAVTTPKGVSIGLPRNTAGKPTAITAQGGGIVNTLNTAISYNANALLQTISTPDGVKTEVASYHVDGQPSEVRRYVNDSQYLSTFYAYDAAGRLISEQDHRGTLSCYDYDQNNNITHVVQGLTGACPTDFAAQPATATVRHTCYGYDDNNRQTTITDGCGGAKPRTRYTHYNDDTGLIHRVEDHGNTRRLDFLYNNDLQLWRTEHDDSGREDRHYKLASGRLRIRADNHNGSNQTLARFKRREYDGNGRLLTVSSCIMMDQPGEPTSDCEAHTVRLRYLRDALGRPAQMQETIDSTGNTRTRNFGYSADGRTVTVTRIADDTSDVYEYDGLGRLIRASHQKGSESYTALAEYDASGRLSKVTDPQGLETIYTHDGLGRQLSRQDVQGTKRWTYDDTANTVTQQMDGDTAVITATYNALNEVVQIVAQDSATGETNTFQFEYDSHGRLARESWTGSGGSGERVYTYNVYGEPTQVSGPFNQVVSYTRDPLGRVDQKTFTGDSVTYSYDAFNRVATIGGAFLPAGQFSFGYDDFTGALTNVNFPNGVETIYPRNPLGELVGLETSNPNGGKHLAYNFAFDLNTSTTQNRWRRDAITATQPIAPAFVPESLTFGYDTTFGRLNTVNSTPVSYDKQGNLTYLPSPLPGTYGYDALNRLTTVGNTQHRYDAARNRIETIRAGVTTRYLWDMDNGLPDLLATLNDNNETQDRYLHGPGGLLAHKDSNGTVRFIHQDFNANVVAITDGNGELTDSYAYTPYGKSAGINGKADFPFRFAGSVGAMTDPEGVVYMRARYYHPGLRQFTSADLVLGNLAKPQSLGRYNYVEGMALTGVDPSGLAATSYQECLEEKQAQGRRTRPDYIREMCSKYNNSISLRELLPSWKKMVTTGIGILEETGISNATTVKMTNRINATFKTKITPGKLGGFLDELIGGANLAVETAGTYGDIATPVEMFVKPFAMKDQPVEYIGELLKDTAGFIPEAAIPAAAALIPAMMDREFAENVVKYAPQGLEAATTKGGTVGLLCKNDPSHPICF